MRFSTWWRRHGIAILGYIAAAIPITLGVDGIVFEPHRKWWLLAGGLTGLAISRLSYTNQQGPKP